MRKGFLASLPGLLVGASLALGQSPQGSLPEAPLPQGESKPAETEPADPSPPPPHPGIWDELTSHFDGTCGCMRGGVFSAEVDYLFWVLRNAKVPVPLASTVLTTAQGQFAGTENLIGEQDLHYNRRPSNGARVTLAYWLEDPVPELDWDRPRTMGIEANYFFVGQRGITLMNDTTPTLVRPFFEVNTGSLGLLPVAISGSATGGITVSANYSLWGNEVNFWKNIYYEYPGKTIRLDFLAGVRYLDLGEDLSVTSLSFFSPQLASGLAGNQLLINDLFYTRNQFVGGQIGAAAKFFLEVVDVTLTGKIAFGGTAEEVLIDGFQGRTLANGTRTVSPGGLLALPSNIGRYHRGDFAVVPEFDITGAYSICRHVSITFGYHFMFWSKVLRPADQIDPRINVSQIPNSLFAGAPATGLALPTVPFHETQFWTQGLSVGLQIVW